MKKLWDYEHAYYMNEGCYFSGECHNNYDSLKDFLDTWATNDIEYNRIHRWDFDDDKKGITFYYILQRKGYTLSCYVKIKPSDHDKIREFLKPHARYNRDLWKGVL